MLIEREHNFEGKVEKKRLTKANEHEYQEREEDEKAPSIKNQLRVSICTYLKLRETPSAKSKVYTRN